MKMVLLLTKTDLEKSIQMKDAIVALEVALEQQKLGKASMPPRMRVQTRQGRMMIMPIALDGGSYMGFKVFTVFESVRSLFALFSSDEGQLLALMDADYLGQVRTGATSAVATKFLSRSDASEVCILGSGAQARSQLEGLCTVRNIKRARVFSPNPEHRNSFAAYASRVFGLDSVVASSPEEAVRAAEIIVTATPSKEPIVKGEWLREGSHINAIGSTLPDRRELDDLTILRCNLIVVDSKQQVLNESGDLIVPIRLGLIMPERVLELWEILAGKARRKSETEITLFKSVGTALQDLAVAAKSYEFAKKVGLGRELGDILSSRPSAAK